MKFDYQVEGAYGDDADIAIKNAETFVKEVCPFVDDWLETAEDKEA